VICAASTTIVIDRSIFENLTQKNLIVNRRRKDRQDISTARFPRSGFCEAAFRPPGARLSRV
jgi:hypothetical protein